MSSYPSPTPSPTKKSKSRRTKRSRRETSAVIVRPLPPRLDAAQRALDIVEVASFICIQLRALVLGKEPIGESKHPFHLPASARRLSRELAPIARVNRAFYSASIPHVLETLDTLNPLLETILGGERADGEGGHKPLIYPHGISLARWSRFESYASKIKTLIIKSESTAMDSPWVSFLESRRPTGMRWFPEVTRLVLTCESPLASFISASIIRQVRFFHILITPSTYADVALLNCALPYPWQSTPGVMAGLRIQHVASPQILLCIPKLGGLRYLYLRISPGTTSQELIHCLGTLTELRRLTIKQDRCDTVPDIPLSTTQGYNAALSRPSRLNDLISLSVDAETAMQCLIAAHISPRSLTSLDLVAQSHRDAVLLPLAIGIHARRNPDLTSLNVQVKEDKNVEGVDPSVRTSAVLHTQDFLTAISTPKRIQSFVIEGVPFFSTDIVDSVLGTIHILHELKVLSLLPVSATSFPRDRLKLGSLRSLQKLAECNPALRSIETLIGGDDPPTLPTEYLSKHHLEKFTALSNGRSPKSTQRRLDVAAFLVRVFPRLQVIAGSEKDEEGVKAWRKVEKIYFSHRRVGAQAVATDEVVKKKKSKRRNRG